MRWQASRLLYAENLVSAIASKSVASQGICVVKTAVTSCLVATASLDTSSYGRLLQNTHGKGYGFQLPWRKLM